METRYYEVVSIDGDYANLKRTDIAVTTGTSNDRRLSFNTNRQFDKRTTSDRNIHLIVRCFMYSL